MLSSPHTLTSNASIIFSDDNKEIQQTKTNIGGADYQVFDIVKGNSEPTNKVPPFAVISGLIGGGNNS